MTPALVRMDLTPWEKQVRNEIYQPFSLYFVVQGLLWTALCQAASGSNSRALCKLWWLPFWLSLLTNAAAMSAALHMLHYEGRMEVEKEHVQEMKLMDDQVYTDKRRLREPSFLACIFHPSLRAYTMCVMLGLTLFAGFLLVTCTVVLCGAPPCSCFPKN